MGEWSDAGVSTHGPVEKRLSFLGMVSFARKNRPEFVLVRCFCRLSRDQAESIHDKSKLSARGVIVRSITEQADPNTKEGFLYERLIEIFNPYPATTQSFETMTGAWEKASRSMTETGPTPSLVMVRSISAAEAGAASSRPKHRAGHGARETSSRPAEHRPCPRPGPPPRARANVPPGEQRPEG